MGAAGRGANAGNPLEEDSISVCFASFIPLPELSRVYLESKHGSESFDIRQGWEGAGTKQLLIHLSAWKSCFFTTQNSGVTRIFMMRPCMRGSVRWSVLASVRQSAGRSSAFVKINENGTFSSNKR